ncbi:amidohydrolase [Ruegeria sp. HKCCD8929]|uniref:amidohydrolase n=1 Tax=Ruegeria sp. HKCCD8929 TaxID=2683006 RepID=UPI0014878DDA|nr:amidohydrolase [Ruegeria sp. HKCCD8929]
MASTTLFRCRRIITMDPNRPEATHVAVREGRILAVGDADCVWPDQEVVQDDRLADTVLMPGFVEGHAHMMAGAMWRYAYVGYHDRIDPEGVLHRGMTDIADVIERLRGHEAGLPEGQPLVAWGFDPIFIEGDRLGRAHLDRISATRPIVVLFSNFHLMCANSAALALAGYDRHSNIEGVVKGLDGAPTGELQEMAAMFPVMRRTGIDFRALTQRPDVIETYAQVCRRAGVTTATDLFAEMEEADVDTLLRVTGQPGLGLRLVPALGAAGGDPERIAERALALRARSTDRLRLGAVKLMTDGSIQGWTARVKWPGYVGGQPNGLWNTPPDQIFALCAAMQRHGVQMHIHVNGDEASDVSLAALEAAARAHPWPGARHVLQHCQMMGADQFRRCARLGVCANIFANHIWYFGDQHAALTIGEDRAMRMNAARSALDEGVRIAIHSDAPVTPMGPLFTAWCAMNRTTMSGRVLGAAQRITVGEALYAITLGAAYTLGLDGEIGSIETGKIADFAILGEDPTRVAPEAIRDVPVLGTVSGGEVHLL